MHLNSNVNNFKHNVNLNNKYNLNSNIMNIIELELNIVVLELKLKQLKQF